MAFIPPSQQPGAGAPGPQPIPPPGQMPGQPPAPPAAPALMTAGKTYTDPQLVEKFLKEWKPQSFDQRWVYERQWMRNVWYILNRQWIYFDTRRGQWQDKRLAKWIPRPVTNILKDGVQTVRANFAAINYGATARPVGEDNINVVTAGVADDYIPLLHQDHQLDTVMNEGDFWQLVTGNVFYHTAVSFDRRNGTVDIKYETCLACQQGPFSEVDIAQNQQKCPSCGAVNKFMPATNPDGSPMVEKKVLPAGFTQALSPFEIAYPLIHERFDLAPFTIRMRWRTKPEYENNDDLSQYVNQIAWSKAPAERTMQIFKTLPFQSDLGVSNAFGGGSNTDSEGVIEYDCWFRPSDEFPDGQVIRFAGDGTPLVIHSQRENLPGPLPYHDGTGNPIFTFHHAKYEHVGGRSLGSSLIDPAIHKQDQLNQLDSHALMIIGRMANPVWLEPKGADVEKFTGEPGLVVKWNPLAGGGMNAKPERIPGESITPGVFQYRGIVKEEAQELMGSFDILKGQKPSGVEAYAAMQLLLERGQAKHASAYKERAAAYRGLMGDALSIEQEFGPESRVRARMGGNRQWSFDHFKKADLKGSIEIVIEDGTQTPKTNLGERAAIDHLNQLMLIDPTNQDTKRKIYEKFGQSDLLPEIDAQVQEAWMNMDKFEKFISDPAQIQGMMQQLQAPGADPNAVTMPLTYKRWYNAAIHRAELIKWILSDRGRACFTKNPSAEMMVDAYLAQIDMALMATQAGMVDQTGMPMGAPGAPGAPGAGTPPGGAPPPPGAGGGAAGARGAGSPMGASNRNAGGVGPTASGAGGTAQPQA